MTWVSELRATPSNVTAQLTLTVWVITLTTLGWTNFVSAQEEAVAEVTPTAVEAVDQPSDADTSNSPPPQADPTGAVLDYKPSESISEDLSVSFPVDI